MICDRNWCVQIGIVALVALSGLVAFTLFFLAATVNAIFVSLLISLAVAGGFLVLIIMRPQSKKLTILSRLNRQFNQY